MEFAKRFAALAATAACALLSAGADASVLTFAHSVEYDGGTSPAGTAPWIVATFDDRGSPGTVTLTITSRLSGGEFLDRVQFNLDPALDPAALRFTQESATGAFNGAFVFTETDGLRAGGGSMFDIKLMFETDLGAGRFDEADSVVYSITGLPNLTARSFDFGSIGGSKTNLLTAAYVQGISTPGLSTPGVQIQTISPMPGGSGWVTVPEPASAVLPALCAAGLLCQRRRRSNGSVSRS